MKYYIAGPMTGIPQFNYPAFHAAAALLRQKGFEVVSPAEQDPEETQAEAMASKDGALGTTKETWGDMLARDVKLIADQVDGICFLPGWEKSRGARLEAFTGLLTGKKFALLSSGGVVSETDAEFVRGTLRRVMP